VVKELHVASSRVRQERLRVTRDVHEPLSAQVQRPFAHDPSPATLRPRPFARDTSPTTLRPRHFARNPPPACVHAPCTPAPAPRPPPYQPR
jgi:hypothetical protein